MMPSRKVFPSLHYFQQLEGDCSDPASARSSVHPARTAGSARQNFPAGSLLRQKLPGGALFAPPPSHDFDRGRPALSVPHYCSSFRSACGSWLACESAETAAWTSTWLDTSLLCSAARSTSMMEDFAASMFSSEVASCWPRNSKRETRPPSEARASEMTSMAPSTSDMADSAAVMVATLAPEIGRAHV